MWSVGFILIHIVRNTQTPVCVYTKSYLTFRSIQVTVLPSHVDVRTQSAYQRMDGDFVGVILSCFARAETDGGSVDRVQIAAFRATSDSDFAVVPVFVASDTTSPSFAAAVAHSRLQDVLLQEERCEFDSALARTSTVISATHLSAIHDTAVCRVLQLSVAPLLKTLKYEALQLEIDLERRRAKMKQKAPQVATVEPWSSQQPSLI